MGHRRHERFKKQLTVKIYGSDSLGQPFSQTASVVDVSEQGLRLEGVQVLDRPGRSVVVERRGDKALYRVIWVGAGALAGQAGLMNLEPQKSIFDFSLPPSGPDQYVMPPPPPEFDHGFRKLLDQRRLAESRGYERRLHPRYACCGDAEVYAQDAKHPERGRLSDLSRGGCFVEMLPPIAVDTKVSVVLLIARRRIRAEGVVRSLLPNFGVGVQFLRFEPEDLQRLEEMLAALEKGAPLSAIADSVSPPPAPAAPATPSDPQRALERVKSWFGEHELLTRQEFLTLLKKVGV
jgi:hypothetical protein